MSDFDPNAIIAAAREAGALALARWREGGQPDCKVWEKKPGSPVCDIDLAVDELLKKRLAAILPEAGWLSEETVDDSDRTRRDWTWLVDPVDGTRDYIRGRSGWAVSIALMRGGRPVFSVIHAPVDDRCFTARRSEGAWLNGKPIHASARAEITGARVPSDGLAKVDRDLAMVPKPNSIALRICMVAGGEADLVAALRWGNEWDVAAANLIAAEAGAAVSDALGDAIRYNKAVPKDFGLIVCAPAIHGAVVERLAGRVAEILTRN